MSNSLDTDQSRRLVGTDLGPNCLQKLSADDASRQIALNYLTTYNSHPQCYHVWGFRAQQF